MRDLFVLLILSGVFLYHCAGAVGLIGRPKPKAGEKWEPIDTGYGAYPCTIEAVYNGLVYMTVHYPHFDQPGMMRSIDAFTECYRPKKEIVK